MKKITINKYYLYKLNEKSIKKKKKRIKQKKNKFINSYSNYRGNFSRKNKIFKLNRKKKLNEKLKNKQIEIINFPSNFSIIKNHMEVIPLFELINQKIYSGIPVNFNKKNVRHIGIESLLYLIATIDRFKHSGVEFWLSGVGPKFKKCREIFIQSGFLKFVKHNNKHIKYDKNYYQIKSGSIVDPLVSKSLIDFVMLQLELEKKFLSGLYRMIIELMCNTREHAYPPKNGQSVTKWYIIAQQNKEKEYIDFCFLDTGIGIPSTVLKNFPEQIKQLFYPLLSSIVSGVGFEPDMYSDFLKISETDLIVSTLQGAFRTRTAQSYRGKGLPCIFDFSEKNYIQNLVVISHNGFFDVRNKNKKIDLESRFFGTLYSWRISKQNIINSFTLLENE